MVPAPMSLRMLHIPSTKQHLDMAPSAAPLKGRGVWGILSVIALQAAMQPSCDGDLFNPAKHALLAAVVSMQAVAWTQSALARQPRLSLRGGEGSIAAQKDDSERPRKLLWGISLPSCGALLSMGRWGLESCGFLFLTWLVASPVISSYLKDKPDQIVDWLSSTFLKPPAKKPADPLTHFISQFFIAVIIVPVLFVLVLISIFAVVAPTIVAGVSAFQGIVLALASKLGFGWAIRLGLDVLGVAGIVFSVRNVFGRPRRDPPGPPSRR